MHRNVYDAEFYATKSDAPPCSDATGAGYDCNDLQGPLWFGLLCRHVQPTKPWLWLMDFGVKERSSHNYVAGHSMPDATVMRDIIKSPDGYRALVFIMQINPPAWWREVQEWRRKATLADAFAMGLGNAGQNDRDPHRGGSESNVDPGTR